MHDLYSRPEVTVRLLDEPWNREYTLNRLGDLLGFTGTLALVIEEDGTPVGDVMIWTTTYGNAKMGWVLDPDARNTASAKLATRVGMTQEAHFRANWWSKGEWTGTLVFAVLPDDADA